MHTSLPDRRRQALTLPGVAASVGRYVRLAIWRDRAAIAFVAASVLIIAGLVAYVSAWLPTLPPLLPLHYNGAGSVDLIGPRTDLFKMPGIGAIVLVADLALASLIHRWERPAALALLAASVLVQVMLVVATINLVRLAFGD